MKVFLVIQSAPFDYGYEVLGAFAREEAAKSLANEKELARIKDCLASMDEAVAEEKEKTWQVMAVESALERVREIHYSVHEVEVQE